MAKYSKKQKISPEIIETADNIAQGIKKPSQTKAQSKLISQGIQKGIEQYKKQQKNKSKEQDKRFKKRLHGKMETNAADSVKSEYKQPWLPWILLAVSWLGFLVYFAFIISK